MAFETPVVREDLSGRQQERGSTKGPKLTIVCEKDRRETDPITAEAPPDVCGFFQSHFEMPAGGLQPTDLLAHGVGEGRVTAAEAHDYRVGIFAQQAEEPFFKCDKHLATK